MNRVRLFIPFAVALALFAGTGRAGAREGVTLRTIAQTEVTVVNEWGEKETRLTDAARVTPGTEVIYTIQWKNDGKAPAENVVITNPVPQAMVCRAIDGAAEARVTVSIDGGKTFAPLAGLVVALPNGTTRPATPADCTHVRWSFPRPVAPGMLGEVRFRATLL
jgi:uncharacterized repeat protein (TIGR01451 family)